MFLCLLFAATASATTMSTFTMPSASSRMPKRRTSMAPRMVPAVAIPGNSFAEVVTIDGTLNFLNIYNAALTGRILLSWFPQAQGVALLRPLFQITDPYLNLFRGLGLQIAGLDLSVLPAFFLLSASTNAVAALGAELPERLQPRRARLSRLDRRAMAERSRAALRRAAAPLDALRPLGALTQPKAHALNERARAEVLGDRA